MSQPLARVTGNFDDPRGPDAIYTVLVDRRWFGKSIFVALPRNLNCARCEGGGCDDCKRGGAVSLRERGAEPGGVRVALPALPQPERDLRLRIPGEGGHSSDPELGRGHLLLTVRPAEESSPEVVLSGGDLSTLDQERRDLIKRSGIMAACLVLLFIGLLRLSGWL